MIRFEQVSKFLGGRWVLDEFDLTIQKGETFFIVGTSGAGKSVTMKHMVRLLTPDEGRVWVGEDCVSEATGKELGRIRSRFGVLFQGAALLQWLSVYDNVALPLREHLHLGPEEMEERILHTLELLDLEDSAYKMPAELSGGMRKRVGLARAVIMQPEIVLYDEPTSGLDPVTARVIDGLIDHLQKQMNVTSVVVTHDLHSALSIGHRIGMVHDGKMVEVARPCDFIRSAHPVVVDFLDSQYITRRGSWEESCGDPVERAAGERSEHGSDAVAPKEKNA